MKKTRKARWFRTKEYGWGWYPSSWQGWLITALYAFVYTFSVIFFVGWLGAAKEAAGGLLPHNTLLGIVEFLGWMLFLSASMIHICYRTGGKPRWHWGPADSEKK